MDTPDQPQEMIDTTTAVPIQQQPEQTKPQRALPVLVFLVLLALLVGLGLAAARRYQTPQSAVIEESFQTEEELPAEAAEPTLSESDSVTDIQEDFDATQVTDEDSFGEIDQDVDAL